jgi:hypothetical protein
MSFKKTHTNNLSNLGTQQQLNSYTNYTKCIKTKKLSQIND